jgi:hypothetical protein
MGDGAMAEAKALQHPVSKVAKFFKPLFSKKVASFFI